MKCADEKGNVTHQNKTLTKNESQNMTPAGLEPAIPGSVGRCLIHWATGPMRQEASPVLSTLLRELVFEVQISERWACRAADEETSEPKGESMSCTMHACPTRNLRSVKSFQSPYSQGVCPLCLKSGASTVTSRNDSEGIRTPAGRAQWISSPSP